MTKTQLPQSSFCHIRELIKEIRLSAGDKISFNHELESGVYVYKLHSTSGEILNSNKLIIIE